VGIPGLTMRILLATDGSAPADLAVAWIAGRPWADEAVVRVVAIDDAYGEERHALEASLERASGQLQEAGLAVEACLMAGRAASLLLAEAEKWRADLIVVGSRGRGRVTSLLLGSVSTEILERARVPVLVVRRAAAATALVAVDGSTPAREVAPFLCATGAFARTRVTVVSVSRDAEPWPPSLDIIAARAATRAAGELGRCGIEAGREVLVGEPAETILARAEEIGADLVAVGSRGQSRLRGLVLGSVARNVASSAAGNVLVVRRPPRARGR
jgi:nucleotide-binding universal stress UspA family protein